jgi:hypothetical protein
VASHLPRSRNATRTAISGVGGFCAGIQDAVGDDGIVLESFSPPERVVQLLRGRNLEKARVTR